MPDAQDVHALESRARESELRVNGASSRNAALEAAIETAELYLKALKFTTDEAAKRRLNAKCKALLTRAESIKQDPSWSHRRASQTDEQSRGPREGRDRGPVSTRSLETREKRILLESSRLNGFVFPPWEGPPDPAEFELKDGMDQFKDGPDLTLSDAQLEVFDGWKRPEEVLPPRDALCSEEVAKERASMRCRASIDLVQDVTTDCSVVASLCAGAARVALGHSRVLSSIIYPYDQAADRPQWSISGKYILRLNFNGCWRKVVIDDRLPASKTSRTLHVIDRNNPGLLWPCLLEKAYLKVRGGYDFPGSNSGTDLWILTGWIPEHVFLQDDEVSEEQLWRRIFHAFSYGDLMISLGTGTMTPREERHLGLIGEHDYAVLNVREVGGHRLLLVKNPWAEGTVWKGNFLGPATFEVEGNSADPDDWSERLRTSLREDGIVTPGTFWIDLTSLMAYFESMYLNWNPVLFSNRQDHHFLWHLSQSRSPSGSFIANPQYSIISETDGIVWILLNRHFRNGREGKKDEVQDTEKLRHQRGSRGFISLYAFNNNGYRVFLSDGAIEKGPYVDSPQTLLRLKIPAATPLTVVVSEECLPAATQSFTISAFSRSALQINPARDKFLFRVSESSAWTTSTAGGNSDFAEYVTNPQFALTVPEKTNLILILEVKESEISVNVKLLFSGGKRVAKVVRRDIIGDSGVYRRGCALTELKDLEAGLYTVVCSTFSPGQTGEFTISASSDVHCTLKPLPAEGAGRLHFNLVPAVFAPGVDRVVAEILPQRLTRSTFIACHQQLQDSTGSGHRLVTRSPFKLSVDAGRGPNRQVLIASEAGEFSDSPAGVRTDDIDLSPQDHRIRLGMWLVLERMSGVGEGKEEIVQVTAFSERDLVFGPWEAEDID